MSKKFPHVYIDVAIGTRPVGRMVFELFSDLTPRTAENFRGLCTGEYPNIGLKNSSKKLHYLNCKLHRIIDDFMIQGGDITNGDGTGGYSIYGPTFEDENFQRRHACAGLLSMANRGRNTNSSQFFITLKPCPHLDGKHVVFGQIIYGMEVVRRIGKTPVDSNNRPKLQVVITDCGEVGDAKDFLRFDPFKAEELQKLKEANRRNVLAFEEAPLEPTLEDQNAQDEEEPEDANKKRLSAKVKLLSDEVEQLQEGNLGKRDLPADKADKLAALMARKAEALKANLKAVIQEENLQSNPDAARKYRDHKRQEYQKVLVAELEYKGIAGKEYLNKPAITMGPGVKKKSQVMGWDAFSDDNLYRAYDKRCQEMPFFSEEYKRQMADPNTMHEPSNEKVERMAEDIVKQKEARAGFSRRRTFDPEEEVTYINERNRVYNLKLQRHYKEHAAETKANLERGTALNN
jgi:peptidyl-prolyl isomerase G (cyclophilin G)